MEDKKNDKICNYKVSLYYTIGALYINVPDEAVVMGKSTKKQNSRIKKPQKVQLSLTIFYQDTRIHTYG